MNILIFLKSALCKYFWYHNYHISTKNIVSMSHKTSKSWILAAILKNALYREFPTFPRGWTKTITFLFSTPRKHKKSLQTSFTGTQFLTLLLCPVHTSFVDECDMIVRWFTNSTSINDTKYTRKYCSWNEVFQKLWLLLLRMIGILSSLSLTHHYPTHLGLLWQFICLRFHHPV